MKRTMKMLFTCHEIRVKIMKRRLFNRLFKVPIPMQ